jgi:hypothetical protein
MASKLEIEMRWADAWNDLYELIGDRNGIPYQLPDGAVVDVEVCKGWFQDRGYEGLLVGVSQG